MSFHYVDRIFELEPRLRARGIKNVTRNESFFYWLPTGERVISPAVVTEALAQLGAWLKMYSSDFTKRPVLLADELTSYQGWARVGDQIDLHVEIVDYDDDVVVSKSYAEVNGKRILTTECCRGYMLPMEEFDDRNRVIKQFQTLHKPDLSTSSRIHLNEDQRLSAFSGHKTWDALSFVDGILDHLPGKKVVGIKNFSACEPYFATHFPYKPVVPGVLLMTFMGEVCQYLIRDRHFQPLRAKALIPTFIKNVRFRKFVEPGDQCVLSAELIEGSCDADGNDILVRAQMSANDKRVMQADMGFRTMFGIDSLALKKPLPFVR